MTAMPRVLEVPRAKTRRQKIVDSVSLLVDQLGSR
jgi:hypothetical protein